LIPGPPGRKPIERYSTLPGPKTAGAMEAIRGEGCESKVGAFGIV